MSPEYDHLGPTASLVARAIQAGKDKAHTLSLEVAALTGERDRLNAKNHALARELDFYKRAHRGDV